MSGERTCNACGVVIGAQTKRFRCLECRDFDICQTCAVKGGLAVPGHDDEVHHVYPVGVGYVLHPPRL